MMGGLNTVGNRFNGTGYGALGKQDRFSNGTTEVKMLFDLKGGLNNTSIRLPKEAIVQNATVNVSVDWPISMTKPVNLTGAFAGDEFGASVSGAGDVNGDGYEDAIVGARFNTAGGIFAGCANIYFGGPEINNISDVCLTGSMGEYFGSAVSGAGDLNGDGYDDIIAGAPNNRSGYPSTGSAYIYFGGPAMDNISDVNLAGSGTYYSFGSSVSGAGDVNNDGYDDAIVGSQGSIGGRAIIFYGGHAMDNKSDVCLSGAALNGYFGSSVSEAGDINKDGYDDVIVGAYRANGTGEAYIYFGGPAMDNISDVNLLGAAPDDGFGMSVSSAGDVNNDGFDDVIVGAPNNNSGGYHAGRAYIYFGGPVMNCTPDVTLTGADEKSGFGSPVSCAGDLNNDGYDDIIIGAPSPLAWGTDKGRAYIFFSGPAMDSIPDVTLFGAAGGDYFGSASDIGDMNMDGYAEIIVGAPWNDASGNNAGSAYIYSSWPGILNPSIKLGTDLIWNGTGYIAGVNVTNDFSDVLNDYLRGSNQSGSDRYGNHIIDVPLISEGGSAGNIILSNLSVVYRYEACALDFASQLNEYISIHKGEKDINGNITVPIIVRSRSAGIIKLAGLNITYDGAPRIIRAFPKIEIDEDTINNSVIDLQEYIKDDYDIGDRLMFKIENATNTRIVGAGLYNNRYLSIDALNGEANDNWTGVVSVRIRCADSHGSAIITDPIDIIIGNVNDPPVILSSPPRNALANVEYVYQLALIDGDKDDLAFILSEGPEKMKISAEGKINWTPPKGGIYFVSIAISDGMATTFQNFTITVSNRPPRFTSAPPTNASMGVQYTYNAEAVDEDDDHLIYSLAFGPEGMNIDSRSGALKWIPAFTGVNNVSLEASDGNEKTYQNFSVLVSENHQPVFTSTPVTHAIVGVQMIYEASALDMDGDNLSYTLVKEPEGMNIDSATGKILWTPTASQITDNAIGVKVTDGRGGMALQEFNITVREAVKPKITINSISRDEKMHEWLAVRGNAINGTWDIVGVEISIDSGGWQDTTGTVNWISTIDTTKLKDGKHTLEARAYDGHDYSEVVKKEFTVAGPSSGLARDWPYFLFSGLALILAIIGSVLYLKRRKKTATSQYPAIVAEPASVPELSQDVKPATTPFSSSPAAEPEVAPRHPAAVAGPATVSLFPANAVNPEEASQYVAPASYQEATPELPSLDEISQAELVPAMELTEVKRDAAASAWAGPHATTGPKILGPASDQETPVALSQPAKKSRSLDEIMAALKGH